MKRCPECRRDYFDDSLRYCLDDGSALLEGPAIDGKPTEILQLDRVADQATIPMDRPVGGRLNIGTALRKRIPAKWLFGAALIVMVVGVMYWFGHRESRSEIEGSFRDVSSPAYDYYLRGKLDADSQNPERNENAIRVLQEVVAADPSFAPALAALARAYAIEADIFKDSEQKRRYVDAKYLAEKAIAIDPSLSEAHVARGAAIWNHMDRFPHEQAIMAYKKAIALDPENEEARHRLGLVYYHIGLLDKGEAELRKSLDLDPSNSLVRFRIAIVQAYKTNYDGALDVLKTVPRDANSVLVDRAMAGVLFQLGRTEEAWKIVEDNLASQDDKGGNVTSVKAMLLARAGRRHEAEEAIRRTIEIGQGFQHFHHAAYNIASSYAMLGDRDEALKWLTFTADNGFPCYPLFEKDPNLDDLRSDDRFTSLLADMKQRWERWNATL